MAPANDEPMGSCPLCGAEVSENLLLFGGTCPRCLGKIPGEEVATHPGFAEMEKMQKKDDAQKRRRTLAPFLFGATALAGLGLLAVGFVIWNQDPVVEPLNFDELDSVEYEIIAALPEEEPKPGKQPKRTGPKTPVPGGTEAVQPKPAPAPKTPPGLNFSEPGVQVRREGVALSDPDQIVAMIRKVMQKSAPSLTGCYNQALERVPDLQGRWRATFTVGKNGYAKDIQFKGRTANDAPMEKCLAQRVAQWQFTKITVDQPVQKTWKFARN